jgi:hypothetical protein
VIARNRIIGDRIVKRAPRLAGSAAIIQFPVLAREAFIARIAASMKRKRSDDAAEEYLANELRHYARELRKRGISPAVVKREVHSMEPAVRGALWRLMFPLPEAGHRK